MLKQNTPKTIDPRALRFAQDGGGLYIETYGCQMNSGDSEIVLSLMSEKGWHKVEDLHKADMILINTCAVRENAESRVWARLRELKSIKKSRPWVLIGVIGCMAERLKEELIEKEKAVDLVVGPDAYRSLPGLVVQAAQGESAVNTILSSEETYAEISPVRMDKNGVSAFVSIMRGCNNMCTYCIVPYTRGRERSRDAQTILTEVGELVKAGYKEVTLLGQNVNSYKWEGMGFAELLERVAAISPSLRVRFATSHPKDLSDELISVMAKTSNICRSIHLPAQSGSSRMLNLMNRRYTREWYLGRIAAIRAAMPDCAITTDMMVGFCGESPEDHSETVSLMREVGYDFSYMFKYSNREGTRASKEMVDDINEDLKTERLNEIITLQNGLSLESNRRDIGKEFEVLVEGVSKRSSEQFYGRTSQNKVVVFDRGSHSIGDYVMVRITSCSSATLLGERL